jgi:UPF0716 protein FxsA
MLLYLILGFTLVPALELLLLFKIGGTIGGWQTLGVIILTGVIGARLASLQGRAAWQRIQEALAQGRLPTTEMVDGLLIFAAGLVLLTPGFLTDLFGFFLLLPFGRSLVRKCLVARFKGKVSTHMHFSGHGMRVPHREDNVIDVDARDVTSDQ